MRLYAVVIGRKKRHTRYVALHPGKCEAATAKEQPLAIYNHWTEANNARKHILSECGHKDVFVIPLEAKP